MCLSLQEGESIPSFVERFYSKAQPLLLEKLLPLDDSIAAIVASLASYPSLAMHISAVKYTFQTVRDIKEAQLALADFYEPELLQKTPKWEATMTPSAPSMAVSLWSPAASELQRQNTPPPCEDRQKLLAGMEQRSPPASGSKA